MAFEHEVAYLTAKIEVEPPNAPKSIGTGFFYRAPLKVGSDRFIALLISNRHVFRDPQGRLTISLNLGQGTNTPALGNIKTFNQVGFESGYCSHPDPAVDLACINASILIGTDVVFKWIEESFLQPIDYEKVALGSDVIFVGYPAGFYDVANNLPLLRRGAIASVPDVDFNGKGQIVIDAQVFRGSSGSPVFVGHGDRYLLLGVLSQAVFLNSELQIVPANMQQVEVEQALGLGIVIKQRHVQELIDHAVREYLQQIGE